MSAGIELAERGWVPDALTRWGIRRLLRARLRSESARFSHDRAAGMRAFVRAMRSGPLAAHTDAANAQHYEVPAAFFERVLGPQRKYSSAYWPEGTRTLEEAESAMLALTCERAGLRDGQRVLELGCGWGSLTLWLARRHPRSRILAVSNSASQRASILERACAERLTNVEVRTCDMNAFSASERFDRIVSVEMFEHMRNWEALLARARTWLREDGALFLHVFAHRSIPYWFEIEAADDWMGRHFFTGGMMPSADLLDWLEIPFTVERRWNVNGRHYAKTAEAWLANADASRRALLAVLADAGGPEDAERRLRRWRLFFLACAELFAFDGGRAWLVHHARLVPRP